MPSYLVNSTLITQSGASSVIRSGELLSDAAVIAAVQAAGGQVVDSGDTVVAAAAVIAAYQRSVGQSEALCDQIMQAAYAASVTAQKVQRVTVDIPLATITAQVSGTAFALGAALPANARVVDNEISCITPLSGAGATSAHATLQGGTDAAGSMIASSDVFTAAGTFAPVGSNPYTTRGGQQLYMTITGDGAHALSTLLAGHLSVSVFYTVTP